MMIFVNAIIEHIKRLFNANIKCRKNALLLIRIVSSILDYEILEFNEIKRR